jgi:hypothetical protein
MGIHNSQEKTMLWSEFASICFFLEPLFTGIAVGFLALVICVMLSKDLEVVRLIFKVSNELYLLHPSIYVHDCDH